MKKILSLLVIVLVGFGVVFGYNTSQGYIQDHLTHLNQYRAANGAQAVTLDTNLSKCAQDYAERMLDNNRIGHVQPNGNGPQERCRNMMYGGLGENLIATKGYVPDGLKALELWKTSPGHDRIQKYLIWKYAGFGVARDEGKKNARRVGIFSDGPPISEYKPPVLPPITTVTQGVQKKPISDMLWRNIGKASIVQEGEKKLLKLQINLYYEVDWTRTSQVSRDILTTLKRLFDPL